MRMMLLVLVAVSVAACANEVTAPTMSPSPENSLATVEVAIRRVAECGALTGMATG
jgi:hypothetical protein